MDNELTFGQLYADLVAANRAQSPPAESFTAQQYAEDIGRSESTAHRQLAQLVRDGKLDYV